MKRNPPLIHYFFEAPLEEGGQIIDSPWDSPYQLNDFFGRVKGVKITGGNWVSPSLGDKGRPPRQVHLLFSCTDAVLASTANISMVFNNIA